MATQRKDMAVTIKDVATQPEGMEVMIEGRGYATQKHGSDT